MSQTVELTPWEHEIAPEWTLDMCLELIQVAGFQLPVRIMEMVFCMSCQRMSLRVLYTRSPRRWLVYTHDGIRAIENPGPSLTDLMKFWTARYFEFIGPHLDRFAEVTHFEEIRTICCDWTQYVLEPDEEDERVVYWNNQFELLADMFEHYDLQIDRVWQFFGLPSVRDSLHISASRSSSTTRNTLVPPWYLTSVEQELAHFSS